MCRGNTHPSAWRESLKKKKIIETARESETRTCGCCCTVAFSSLERRCKLIVFLLSWGQCCAFSPSCSAAKCLLIVIVWTVPVARGARLLRPGAAGARGEVPRPRRPGTCLYNNGRQRPCRWLQPSLYKELHVHFGPRGSFWFLRYF